MCLSCVTKAIESFLTAKCEVQDAKSGQCILTAPRSDNVYTLYTNHVAGEDLKCLKALTDNSRLWHRKLGHISLHSLNKLISKGLVRGLPSTKLRDDELCKDCTQGKQTRSSFKPKKVSWILTGMMKTRQLINQTRN